MMLKNCARSADGKHPPRLDRSTSYCINNADSGACADMPRLMWSLTCPGAAFETPKEVSLFSTAGCVRGVKSLRYRGFGLAVPLPACAESRPAPPQAPEPTVHAGAARAREIKHTPRLLSLSRQHLERLPSQAGMSLPMACTTNGPAVDHLSLLAISNPASSPVAYHIVQPWTGRASSAPREQGRTNATVACI